MLGARSKAFCAVLPAALLLAVLAGPPAAAGATEADSGPAGLSAAPPAARAAQAALRARLARLMRGAGGRSGAFVQDLEDERILFRLRSRTRRVLASNTKLFTTAAMLDRAGPATTLETAVLGAGALEPGGVWRGDLILRGGGDPTFSSSAFARRHYAGGGTVQGLADELVAAGVTQVTGRVVGDESRFDSLRGGPYSGYGVSGYVGPLSALAYNRGLANEFGSAFQRNPPAFAAARLTAALEARGVDVARSARAGVAPTGATELADVASPSMRRLVQITNKRSDNFFAEMLLKELGARRDRGSTAAGARAARLYASQLAVNASLADGSGLSRRNRASPAGVARLLAQLKDDAALRDSLAIAGRDGTLSDRMRSGPARGRCRGKTGTLSNVSALSGYCTTRDGGTVAFSFLMNGVSPVGARRIQDRMAQALAGYRG
jgi:D-alanyl-D-alanine carboxypeptidase/D-alanyl-D-alanine-endopeptidase (penicillin-binding protein 4)